MTTDNKTEGLPETDYKVIYDGIRRAYDYLNATGHFTTPNDEARVVENMLIQSMVRSEIYLHEKPKTEGLQDKATKGEWR